MANITVQTISSAVGSQTSYAAATGGGDTVLVGTLSGVVFRVRNASGSSVTTTLAGSLLCSQGATHNVAVTCPAGTDTEVYIPQSCVSATTGNVAVTYSAVTSVTVAAIDYVL